MFFNGYVQLLQILNWKKQDAQHLRSNTSFMQESTAHTLYEREGLTSYSVFSLTSKLHWSNPSYTLKQCPTTNISRSTAHMPLQH